MNNHRESSFLSYILFSWANKLMRKGRNRLIHDNSDLFKLPSELIARNAYEKLASSIKESPKKVSSQENRRIDFVLWKCLVKSFFFTSTLAALAKLIADLLGFVGPLALSGIVNFLQTDNRSVDILMGLCYCLFLFFASLTDSVFMNYYNFQAANITLQIKTSVICVVYQKLLTIPSDFFTTSKAPFSRGQVINLASIDASRISNFYQSAVALVTLPIQLLVTLYLLYQYLGEAFWVGFVITLIILLINKFICDVIGKINAKMLSFKDQRIKLISEVLSGIKMIKMQSWENILEQKIESTRLKEVQFLKKIKYLDALCVYFWASTPVLISFSTFSYYVMTGNTLTVTKTFTSIALFNKLLMPINALPWVLNGIIEALVSLRMVQEFLDLRELDNDNQYTNFLKDSDTLLRLDNAVFTRYTHSESQKQPTLGPVKLTLKSGSYIGLVGSVGSGKSSLFAAIIGEMKRSDGSLFISKKLLENGIGYLPQEPWIFNGSIRDNILFGKEFYEPKYSSIIQCCALDEDLRILPEGDATWVGDRGIALSGGQKARIALARIIYQEFELYLLDDPYASVDLHVAQHLKMYCIDGILHGKTKILATHHTELVKNAKAVLSLEKGKIDDGNLQSDRINYSGMVDVDLSDTKDKDDEKLSKAIQVEEEPEEREKGRVKLDVYRYYIQSVTIPLSCWILLSFILMQISRNSTDGWLTYWTTYDGVDPDITSYLKVFALLALSNSIFTLIRAFLFAYGTIQASIYIHKTLLRSTLASTLTFFTGNTYGRIINRFSSDISELDGGLPANLNLLLSQVFHLIASFVITIVGIPATIIVIIILAIPYYFIQNYYRATAREVKRLTSASFSPIYTQLSETVTGLSVIRSFSVTTRYISDFHAKLDCSNRCQYSFIGISQWLNVRLQILGIFYTTGVALTAVLLHYYSHIEVNAGLVGLSLAYSFAITGLLNGLVQSFSQLEIDMVSIERIKQYLMRTDKEKDTDILRPPDAWPNDGRIIFDSVSLRYKADAPRALDNISLVIQPKQHVGIVGRTGSGKSTLIQTLLRINDLERGRILLDGIDINEVSLSRVRSSIFIVPQDSYLFSGSIRYNLDPCGKFTDDRLWSALRQCQADELVARIGGLDGEISENGQNISLGERQLLCLSRALLSKCKVICFDETTSSVDKKTSMLLEGAIKTAFRDYTVITIAHKINTIINYDRVLVMDRGQIVEDGSPSELKSNTESRFSRLLFSMSAH